MMNPQYPPPGQNNNAPSNPIFPPTSQDFNGVQNANMYNQMAGNGPQMPPKSFDQTDMSQKLQSMNINAPQGFSTIPPTQLPPGQVPSGQFPPGQFTPGNYPPTSNFAPGQLPPGQRPPGMPTRPPQGPPLQQMSQNPQIPLPSAPGGHPGFVQPPQGETPNMDQNRQFQPPTSMPHQQQCPPSNQSSQSMSPMSQPPSFQGPGQMPPMSQPVQHPQHTMSRPGMPPQGTFPSKPGMPPQPQIGGQMNILPQSQPSPMPQLGMAPQAQPGFPGQPGQMSSQPGQPPQLGPMSAPLGMPPQPGPTPGQVGHSTHPSQMPSKVPGPSQPGMPPPLGPPGLHPSGPSAIPPQPGQFGMPPQAGQIGQPGLPLQSQMQGQQSQHSQISQPGMPPQQGSMSQPGLPTQLGSMSQPRLPPQPGPMTHPGYPPQPGHNSGQPGLPPQPGSIQQSVPPQSGFPPQPGQFQQQQPGQFQQPQPVPGLPHMPPPLSQSKQQYSGLPPSQPGYGAESGQQPGQYPGMPPMPGQLPPQPMPGQQQRGFQQPSSGYPPQYQPQYPGQQPSYPGQQYQPPEQKRLDPEQMPSPIHVMAQDQENRGGVFVTNEKGLVPPLATTDFVVDDKGNASPRYIRSSMYTVPVTADLLKQTSMPFCLVMEAMKEYFAATIVGLEERMASFELELQSAGRGPTTTPNLAGLTADFNAFRAFVVGTLSTVRQQIEILARQICPMAEPVGAEPEPPLVDFAALTGAPALGPVRCARCKAYMCPSMKFVDAGRHFKCAFCKATTEVPMEYTQYINSTQQYGRVPAEMALGAYEIVATKEYCRNNTLPNPPAIVFVIDVSYNAIKSGLVQTVCDNILDIIESLPRDERSGQSWTRVGFITYSSTVHFYNIKGSLAQPVMLSVGDVGDMFVPLLDGFLQTAEQAGAVLPALLQQLPRLFADNKETETILLPACQAGLEALRAADTSGQLLVFHTSLPSYNAPGKLINREDRKLLGTDKEKQILGPQTTAYNELGQACSAAGVSVELFVCNNSYVDCATIGQLPRLTGGQLHKYTYFAAELDGARLAQDVRRVATRPTAHDAVMRVRTSTGVRPTDFYGHLFMSNTTDVELAALDADKAIGIEIKHDDKLTGEDGVYVQAALLYTHRSGQRRLRVLNLALSVAQQLADVYRNMELDTTVNFLTKQAVWALREAAPRAVREALAQRCARSLAAYRRHCASPSSAGQLVLPEPMKLLPLYTNCILRSDAVAGGPDLTCDDRSCAMYRALTADVSASIAYTYPRLLPLTPLADDPDARLQPLRASIDKISDQGVYLLENGVHILLWVGSNAPSEFVRDVFGVAAPQLVDPQVCELPELDTPASDAVRRLIHHVRAQRRCAMRLTVMRQHDKLETVLRHFLVEDRGVDGASSYVDFLCHVHKEIRALL